jgi:hypothetical protein
MLHKVPATITTAADGSATVQIGSKLRGLLVALVYTPGDIATGADLTITANTTGIAILTVTNAGTSKVAWFPRALAHEVADASAASSGSESIPLVEESIKVVVAQGGNAKTGTIEAIIMERSPY